MDNKFYILNGTKHNSENFGILHSIILKWSILCILYFLKLNQARSWGFELCNGTGPSQARDPISSLRMYTISYSWYTISVQ